MTDKTTLPDDPRDCCKAIITELRKVDEWPLSKLPQDFAALVGVLCDGDADRFALAMPALQRLAEQAEDAAKVYESVVNSAWTLARHGTGLHREADERMAAGLPAFGGPTHGAVKAAQRALASVGKTVTDAEAVELLNDESANLARAENMAGVAS